MGRPIRMTGKDFKNLLNKDKSVWSQKHMIVKIKSLEKRLNENEEWLASIVNKLKKNKLI